MWWVVIALEIITYALTAVVQPDFLASLTVRVWPLILVLAALAAFFYIPVSLKGSNDLVPFIGSVVFIVGMLTAAAGALFPVLITSTINPSYSLTAYNASAGSHGLNVGIVWWPIGIALATGYFVFVYRSMSGKRSAGKIDEYSYK